MKRMTEEEITALEQSLWGSEGSAVHKARRLIEALKAERELYDQYHLRAIVDADRIHELQAQVASLTSNMPKSSIDLERENFELKAEVKEANEAALNHAIAAFTAERAQDAAEAKLTNLESQWNDILAVQRRLKELNAKAWGNEAPKP